MARAFTPSRSMIYGAPEREALVDIGNTVMGALTNWGEEKLQADYMEQMSAGSVALSRERNALFGRMTTEKAKSPDDWVPTFQKGKEQIRNKILGGIRQPRARRMMQLKMEEEFADWEAKLGNAAIQQKAANIQTNYEVWREGVKTESNDYSGPMAMDLLMGNVKDVLESVDQAHNAGGLAAHPDVATPEAAELEKRTLVRGLVEDYAVQTALATGDEGVIDNINGITEAIFGDTGKPVFGPEEKAEAKKRYKAMAHAAKTAADQARTERATAAERDLTVRMLKGERVVKDDKGVERSILDLVQDNQDFSPATIRTLSEMYWKDPQKRAETSRSERMTAYAALSRETARLQAGEIGYDRWRRVYAAHAQELDEEDAESFLDKAHAVGRSPSDPKQKEVDAAMKDTDEMATKAFKSLFKSDMATTDLMGNTSETPEPPELAESVGEVLVHMKEWTKARAEEGKPFDAIAFRVERNRKTGEVYRRLYEKDKEPEPVKAPKRSRWTGRITVKTDAEYEALASGTEFIAPDGKLRRKP